MKMHLATVLRDRLHYAWIVAGVGFLTLLVVAGIRATPSVLIVPLEHEFGWSRDRITLLDAALPVGAARSVGGKALPLDPEKADAR